MEISLLQTVPVPVARRDPEQHYPFLKVMEPLAAYYAGSDVEYLFTQSFSEITYRVPQRRSQTWNPVQDTDPTGKIYNAVGYVLDELVGLTESGVSNLVSMYMDMFLPLIHYMEANGFTDNILCTDTDGQGAPIEKFMPNRCFHTGLLPNHVSKLMRCSFWSDSSKQEPIVHLLSKSTPQRCQIRSLAHIVYNYSRLHDDVYDFLFGALRCSLMGVYPGSLRPNFEQRLQIFTEFETLNKHTFLQWIKAGHQQLLFFTMKEYMVFAADCLPALHSELVERYNWKSFESTVQDAMNSVRQAYRDLTMVGVEQQLLAVTKSQTNLYRPSKYPFSHIVIQELEHLDDAIYATSTQLNLEYLDLFYQMLVRVETDQMPFEWLVFFGATEEQCSTLIRICAQFYIDGAKTPLRNFLQEMSVKTIAAIRAMSIAYDRKVNMRMFTLPVHMTVQQIRVLRRLHAVPNGDPADNMGRSMVCLQCKQFKGFVSHMQGGKPVNLYAYGHSKVLIDYTTGDMFCGRRCEKADKKRPTVLNEWDLDKVTEIRQRKRVAKDQRKLEQNERCIQSTLQEVPLLGNVLQFYGALFTVCPLCGNFMRFNPANVYNGMYCGGCIQNGKPVKEIQCERCGDHQHLGDPIMVTSGESIYLCKQHYKPWIREASAVLSKETIMRGLEEKWKRLQSV